MKSKAPVPHIGSVADLARHLGLSDWTVSRAINASPAVKESTRERVLQAMKETGFKPNPLARGLRGKVNGLIGVCFSEYHNTLLIEKLAVLEAFLHEHGLRCILAFAGDNMATERRVLEDFKRLRVEAMVLVQSHLTDSETKELLAGQTCVYVDPVHPHSDTCVSVDRNKGVELLVKHLASLGHRRFGLLGISDIQKWRWPGLMKALKTLGLDPRKHTRIFEMPPQYDSPYEIGSRLAAEVLREKKPPTALVALSDVVAVPAIQYLQSAGFRVPKDFSVTGFDHLEIARYIRPTLTTVDQQPQSLIHEAGQLLLQKLKSAKKRPPRSVIIPPRLVIGESTGPA